MESLPETYMDKQILLNPSLEQKITKLDILGGKIFHENQIYWPRKNAILFCGGRGELC